MTHLDRIARLRADLDATARRLSLDELRELADHAADLERNGFKRRCHAISKHLVDRFSFSDDETTAEYGQEVLNALGVGGGQ